MIGYFCDICLKELRKEEIYTVKIMKMNKDWKEEQYTAVLLCLHCVSKFFVGKNEKRRRI